MFYLDPFPHTHSLISSLSSRFLLHHHPSLYPLSPSPQTHTSSKLQFLSSGVVFTVVVVVVVAVVVVVLYPLTRVPRLWARYNSKFSTSSVSFERRGVLVVAAVLMDCCCCCWRSFCFGADQTDAVNMCFDDARRSNCGPRRTSERVIVQVRS